MGIDLNRFRGGKPSQEWLDWLTDDPVPASIRNRMRARAVKSASEPRVRRVGQQDAPAAAQVKKQQPNADSPKTVSINISVPDMGRVVKKPFIRAKAIITKHKPSNRAIIGFATVIVVAAGLVGFAVIERGKNKPADSSDTTAVLSQQEQKPEFEYSLPQGKESEVEGSVRYDATKKVVNYVDSIGGVNITVSQQPLPSGFKDDTQDKVKKLAEDFSAKDVLSTANPTAYKGTSAKGPQTVIFAKKDLLVFIQSTKEIDDHDWAEYITNLQ